MEVTKAARAIAPTFQRSKSQRDVLLDPSLVMPLAGVTSTMRSTPCYARHLTDVPGLSSIAVLSSSTVARFTWTVGRRLAWCAVRRTVSRVRRSAQSITLFLSGTQLRRPCKMPHGVRFRTIAQCSVGWLMVLTRGITPAVHLAAQKAWLSHLLVRIILG
jgi:hypothetical protein